MNTPFQQNQNIQRVVAAFPDARGVYVVGGAVRDFLMGYPYKDIDLLVEGLTSDRVAEGLRGICAEVDEVGRSFGVFKAKFTDGEVLDTALPRTERSTGAGHKDFAVVTDTSLTVADDLQRRDFTINAIAINVRTGEVVCPPSGPPGAMADVNAGILCAVGDPNERFSEDPLRILRGLRFMARYPLLYEYKTWEAMRQNAHLLRTVSPERIGEELMKLLDGRGCASVISIADSIFCEVIPEWKESVGFEQNNPHHYATVDLHVLDALDYVREAGGSPRARLAVLLHDIAKPATYKERVPGRGSFHGHEDVGADMAASILRRLRFPEVEVKAVSTIIREHLRPPLDPSDKALRNYVAALGPYLEDALMVKYGDLAAHNLPPGFDPKKWHAEILQRCRALVHLSGFNQKSLALDGDIIRKTFGVDGSKIGEYKKRASQAVIDGIVPNERNALLDYLIGVNSNA